MYGLNADIATFDGPSVTGAPNFMVLSQMAERLVFVDYDGSLKPQLAETWDSPDLKVWTFKLRKGVKFHDGSDFNAQAVKSSYDRVMNPDTSLIAKQYQAAIEKVEVIDDFTVRFTATAANASFIPQFVSETRAVIQSPTAITKWGKEYAQHPVGTGPWRLASRKADQEIVLERNPDYWGTKPLLDKVVFKIIPDSQTMLIEVERGTVHLSPNFPIAQVAEIAKSPNVTVAKELQYQLFGYWFNTKNALFSDVNTRKALRLAVDTKRIVDTLGSGFMERARGPVYVPSAIAHPTLQEPDFAPDEAKRILAGLGWKAGSDGVLAKDGKRFSFTFLTTISGQVANEHEIAQAVQRYFADIGVEAKIEELEFGAFLAKRVQRTFDFAWMAIGPRPPDISLTALNIALSCTGNLNDSQICDPEFDKLVTQAAQTSDLAARKQLYYKAQERIWEQYPGIYISNPYAFMLINKKVTNYQHSAGVRIFNLFGTAQIKP